MAREGEQKTHRAGDHFGGEGTPTFQGSQTIVCICMVSIVILNVIIFPQSSFNFLGFSSNNWLIIAH